MFTRNFGDFDKSDLCFTLGVQSAAGKVQSLCDRQTDRPSGQVRCRCTGFLICWCTGTGWARKGEHLV